MSAKPQSGAVAQRYAQAQECHRQGRLDEAEALYLQVIQAAPAHFEALHWLGLLHLGRGEAEAGRARLAQALRIKPGSAETLVYLGHAQNMLQRYDEALASFERALALNPNLPTALNNRGLALRGLKRFDEALASFERALALDPRNAEVLCNRGHTLQKLGRLEDTLASFAQALALRPNFAEALCGGGKALLALDRREDALAAYERALVLKPDSLHALNGKGLALQALGRHEEAAPLYRRALALTEGEHETHNNLAVALLRARRPGEALAHCDRALAIEPDYPDALCNRSAILLALDRHDEALAVLDAVLAQHPAYAGAFINRGNVLQALCRYPEALETYRDALALKPDDADALYNDSLARLCTGDFAEGWRRYECRWTRKEAPPRRELEGKPWLGRENIAGQRLLLWAEQGLGDSLQFCRYAPLLVRRGIAVYLDVPPPLVPLMRTLEGVSGVSTAMEAPPRHDYQCPLLSLPLALAADAPGIPAEVPYLRADPARAESWKRMLAADRGPRIGLVCSGNPNHLNDRHRSIPLRQFAPLLDAGAAFYLLQQDCRPDDADFLAGSAIRDLRAQLVDFTETAAAIAGLDLVISVDTSVVHLAGALGRPVWALLPFAPDWRWMLEREDSPWYPTARLFRQPALGDWKTAIEKVRAELMRFRAGG